MKPRWAERPEDRAKWIRAAGMAGGIGVAMVAPTAIGYLLGKWLDDKLGTYPWLVAICSLMGVAAGFIEVFRIAAEISRNE